VTLPSEAADGNGLVRELMRSGMDAARINCSHDPPAAWQRMIAHVRRASAELSTECRVLMDLSGPKLRTNCSPDSSAPASRKYSSSRTGHVTCRLFDPEQTAELLLLCWPAVPTSS